MSFPNIPDINPDISVTFEDAINLLLTSIAMEEVSLSKLMDAETQKVLCIIKDSNHDSILSDAIKINKSVDDTLKDMIKLQMLLQFKLDNVKEILPTSSSTTTTTSSTSTTSTSSKTTTHTTTCTTTTCSTTTRDCVCCSLTGTGKGCVSNVHDEFYGDTAVLYSFIYCCDLKNRTIRYSVGNNDQSLSFLATGQNIMIQCPTHCSDQVVVWGKGHVKKNDGCHCNHSGPANFTLSIAKKTNKKLMFKMEIHSDTNPTLNHNSGFIQTKTSGNNLHY